MNVARFIPILLAAASLHAQPPAGRWDAILQFGSFKIPFRIDFEGDANNLKASLVNGETRVPSTTARFVDGKLRMWFDRSGAKLDAILADSELKGTIQNSAYGSVPFTAVAFCTCGFVGEAGPDISGTWEMVPAGWRVQIRRKGEDTFATLIRPGEEIGPLAGRYDGLSFTLSHFDGTRAAVLEVEKAKTGGLDFIWKAPGADAKKLKGTLAR